MSIWLLFICFLASGIITAITLNKNHFNRALPLYIITFGLLSMYILFFIGCSLMKECFQPLLPGTRYMYFVEAISRPLNATLPYTTMLYSVYIAVSLFLLVAAVLVAVFAVKAVIRYIKNKSSDFVYIRYHKPSKLFFGITDDIYLKPNLSKYCRLNC